MEAIAISLFILGIVSIIVGFFLLLTHIHIKERCWSSNEKRLDYCQEQK